MAISIYQISSIGNDKNQAKGYYHRLTDLIESEGLLTEQDCHELVCRIESFIEQEIEEIRAENWEEYNSENYNFLEEDY